MLPLSHRRWVGTCVPSTIGGFEMTMRLYALLACAACGGTDPGDPDAPEQSASWHALDGDEPSALLAVWGARADDVWVVGSRATATGGPAILHYDGTAWARVDSGQTSLD